MQKFLKEVVKTTPDMLKPYEHDHRELVAADLKHLTEEIYRACQQHGIPIVLTIEAAFTSAHGESILSMKHFPAERMEKVGMTSRYLLGCFAASAEQHEVQAAVQLLIKKKLIQ